MFVAFLYLLLLLLGHEEKRNCMDYVGACQMLDGLVDALIIDVWLKNKLT
eukprot:m.65181 g.65181  ORF g.65181 m.65181 type:complete len:50 (-) comp11517_c1_seq4:1435-1584(-)